NALTQNGLVHDLILYLLGLGPAPDIDGFRAAIKGETTLKKPAGVALMRPAFSATARAQTVFRDAYYPVSVNFKERHRNAVRRLNAMRGQSQGISTTP